MKINRRTANSIRRRNMCEIAASMGIKRQAVFEWVRYQRVPNKRVAELEELTGLILQ